jgi:hypothetical protein
MEIDYEEEQMDVQKDMTADNIRALLSQEIKSIYTCADYLNVAAWQQTNVYRLVKKPETTASNARIDEYCREQIVEWSFRVVDYFHIDREVVALSMSFLDRFLASCRCDRTSFKLAATTTLHLAVKILYPCKLADLGILSDLSRGEFDMHDVSQMETHVLRALEWNLNPPTSTAFTSLFLDYFFAARTVSMTTSDIDDIYDVSSFFCELAVCDYFFISTRASQVAVAAVLNALEGMFGPENHVAVQVLKTVHELGLIIPSDLHAIRNRLWELYERSEECALHNDKQVVAHVVHDEWEGGSIFVKKNSFDSPVSVSKPCHSATDFFNPPGASASAAGRRNGSW